MAPQRKRSPEDSDAIVSAPFPTPPESIVAGWPERFAPAADLSQWVRAHFITDSPPGAFHNPDHRHLADATLGFLWTNVPLIHQQRAIAGQAEQPTPQGNKWRRGRQLQQIEDWFGDVPDFLITLYAPLFAALSDRLRCAIVEHELYHCAQALDEFGSPKFTKEGFPVFGMRGHDVNQFIGVVRRWGAVDGDTRALVTAALAAPMITDTMMEAAGCACGGRIA